MRASATDVSELARMAGSYIVSIRACAITLPSRFVAVDSHLP
jgi:hypothetical protein